MNVFTRWRRSAAALAVAAVVPLAAAATASAAPVRTATTTDYTHATYLQHALGLPATETDPAIESVTYDHFQWLLQQEGNFPVLIGDPATDSAFAARARDVEAAADAAGVKRVYWFNPNLSGSAKVGNITEPTLDIRNSTAITQINTTSQKVYGYAWLNLVGQYLGNGVTTKLDGGTVGKEDPRISATIGTSTINDAGLSAGGVLYDYSGGSAPAKVLNSYFFVYNKDKTAPGGQAAKILSWVDLTAKGSASQADVAAAITAVGVANLASLDQFAWWKSEINSRQVIQAPSITSGSNLPVLTDADNAAADGGWRINQITYPELVDLLKNGANDANAVILFGGTWCPNTRPVLEGVNKYAQENNVQVFNFDTVLDGGTVGGATTLAENPLQIRNNVNDTTKNPATPNANPTSLYGDLLSQYLTNIKTEYKLGTSSVVSYFPGGDTTGTSKTVNKLQVPFVIGYQGKAGDAPNGGITRQWIVDKGDGTYKEYMSQWWYTRPQPGQLGISATQLPPSAPIWATINAQLANFTWRTDPAPLKPNSGVDTDDAQYLVAGDTAKVTYTPASGNNAASVSVSNNGTVDISPTALAAALTALGAATPANSAASRVALIAAQTATPKNDALIANLTTVAGAWGVAQLRKTTVSNAWGNATTVAGVAGGQAALHALDVFFGGLPGGVVSKRTVTADTVTDKVAPKVTVAIVNDFGRVPAGTVTVVVKKGGTTVASASSAVANDAASITLPVLAAGTYDYTLSYPGDDQIAAFTETGSLTVSPTDQGPGPDPTPTPEPFSAPAPTPTSTPTPTPGPLVQTSRVKVSKVEGAVSKAPTSKKAGKYKLTITTPTGGSAPTGKVTIKLKKGKITKTITGKLSRGTVTVSLPKLAKGTWTVTISWPGDPSYLATSVSGASIKVKK